MEGLGQVGGHFADLNHDAGYADWAGMSGLDDDSPFVRAPTATGDPDATGLVRVAAGPVSADVSGSQHWSNLLNWRQNPMPWLLGVMLLVMGFASVQAGVRVGR